MKNLYFKNILDVDNKLQTEIRNWRNNPDVSKYMYTNHEISEDEHKRWLEALKYKKDIVFFVVYDDDNPIGIVSFSNINNEHKTADWAFYLYPPNLAGKGYGALIEYKAINYAFNNLALNKLNCEVLAFNSSVVKLHKKFGFVEEGIRRCQIRKNNTLVDVVLLGLLNIEWEACKGRIEKILFRGEVGRLNPLVAWVLNLFWRPKGCLYV